MAPIFNCKALGDCGMVFMTTKSHLPHFNDWEQVQILGGRCDDGEFLSIALFNIADGKSCYKFHPFVCRV